GADAAALTPELQASGEGYLWAERPAAEVDLVRMVAAAGARDDDRALTRTVYDVPREPRPWGWKVAGYLWTKSVAAGALLAAALLVVAFFARVNVEELWWLGVTMASALALQAIVLVAELSTGHANADAARAARLISRGPWRTPFWAGVVAAGTVLPIVLVWPNPYSAVLGALLALVGLWVYEDLWLRAGQAVPLS